MSKVSALVVDDAPFIRDLMKKGLRDNFPGLHIEEAVNGRKAQQLLSRQNVDLILCDWEMPEMSGLELLTWCRAQENLKTTPFIMVTSRGDKENVVQAIQAGVSDYIGKPFSNDQLVAKIKKALSRSGKLEALAAHAPRREIASGMANDSLAALTGGRAEVIKPAASPAKPAPAPKPASAPQASASRRQRQPAGAGAIAPAAEQHALRDQGGQSEGSATGGEARRPVAAGAGKRGAGPRGKQRRGAPERLPARHRRAGAEAG